MPWYSRIGEGLSQCCQLSFWTKNNKQHLKEGSLIGGSGLLTLIVVLGLRADNRLPESAAADDFVYTLPVLIMLLIIVGFLIRQKQMDSERAAYQQFNNTPGDL